MGQTPPFGLLLRLSGPGITTPSRLSYNLRARDRRPFVCLMAFIGLSVLTRLVVSHVDVINVDEASYMVGAWELLQGRLPYTAFGDNKPPLIALTINGTPKRSPPLKEAFGKIRVPFELRAVARLSAPARDVMKYGAIGLSSRTVPIMSATSVLKSGAGHAFANRHFVED